jgi:diaminohydroxyphosphoribosylaminopyrimidine deaminase (EC 3.5.4.26)/5-amino-6-(5-phosphoribosylamino)uracil reductase (EC 1.1.1.193)
MDKDIYYMKLALEEAYKYKGQTHPNPAVGAIIVKDDKILSIGAHKKAGTDHAEIVA